MFKPMRKTHPLFKILNSVLIDLPAPNNLSIWWNFGSLLGLCLVAQLVTGILLSMHYTPHIDSAFSSVAHISRDVYYGWFIRSIHANGASWFFICLYLHMARNLYYGSFFMLETWNIGVLLFILTMATAFTGYMLPWGQMSFWGASVITSLFSTIPYMGTALVEWLWGGTEIGNPTLNRFFGLHFLLPFIITAMMMIHIMFLHQTGSNNPLGINSNADKIPFHWYYTSKDILGAAIMILSIFTVVLFWPNILGDPDNFTPANPMMAPLHIKPEWYFLWAYAILRSIPNKLGGVTTMFAAMLILFTLPILFTPSQKYAMSFYAPYHFLFWSFTAVCSLLTWIGGSPAETPYDALGQLSTIAYFSFFLLGGPTLSLWNLYLK